MRMKRIDQDLQSHFKIVKGRPEDKKSIISCECHYCRNTWTFYNATKMRLHLMKSCKSIPNDIKKKISGQEESINKVILEEINVDEPSVSEPQSSDPQASAPHVSALQTPQKRKRIWGSLEMFTDKMTSSDQKKIDEQLVIAIISGGVPFFIVENKHWLMFFKALRPAYQPPLRYSVSNPLLNAEYHRVISKRDYEIESSKFLSLSTDGWTNIRGEGIVNFVIHTPKPVFYKAIQPKEKRETAEFICGEIKKILIEVGPKKFMALITDNAANMKAAWKLVREIYPHINCFGCAAHGLNLLICDITRLDFLKDLIKTLKKVIKYVRYSHVNLAVFTQKQKELYGIEAVTLKIPCKTRWSGAYIMCESILKNKRTLQSTIIDEAVRPNREIREVVLDDENTWPQIEALRNLLKPIATSISILESDFATLAEVPQLVGFIRNRTNGVLDEWPLLHYANVEYIKTTIMNRIEFICQPIHMAANLLHPEYKGSVLGKSQETKAVEFIAKQCEYLQLETGQVLSNLAECSKQKHWLKKFDQHGKQVDIWVAAQHCEPAIWWEGLCSTESLTPIAVSLHKIPPMSSSCERVWSAYENTHTKKRNRLLNERVEKLVAVKWNLNMLNSEERPAKGSKQLNLNDFFIENEMLPPVSPLPDFCNSEAELPVEFSDESECDSDCVSEDDL